MDRCIPFQREDRDTENVFFDLLNCVFVARVSCISRRYEAIIGINLCEFPF